MFLERHLGNSLSTRRDIQIDCGVTRAVWTVHYLTFLLPVVCVLHVLRATLWEEPRDPLADVRAGRGVARDVRSERGRAHVASAARVTPPPPLPAIYAATLVNRNNYRQTTICMDRKVYRPGEHIWASLQKTFRNRFCDVAPKS